MSSSQPLKTLLTIKRTTEQAAAQALALETARCAAAEATGRRLDEAVEAARHDLRIQRERGASIGCESVARALERQRFWARLTDEIAARATRARVHHQGELAAARASVSRATTAHQAARQAREVVDRLCSQAEAAVARAEARRQEVALDEQGQDIRAHARGQNRGPRRTG